MSDIPDDILAAAAAVVERGYDEGLIDAVCRALMAERQACAQAAHDCLSLEYQNDYGSLADAVSQAILERGEEDRRAIRRGTPHV